MGEYQGEVVASTSSASGDANYDAVRVTYTDPQAAAVGATEGALRRHRAAGGRGQDRHLHTPTPIRTASSPCSATANG
jgi:pyruvate/2-oxoglutarate dehydrogenase complex dihydrolipoamide dehydrogenase (E3) component